MNQYPLWKTLLISSVILIGGLYALPNLFGEDPALQISATRTVKLDESKEKLIASTLKTANITPLSSKRMKNDDLLVRFHSVEDQLKAADKIKEALTDKYTVALNLAPATPQWLLSVGALPMYMGLDLRGGIHVLIEVDMDAAIKKSEERYVGDIRRHLIDKKIRYRGIKRLSDSIELKFNKLDIRNKATTAIKKEFGDLEVEERDESGLFYVTARLSERERKAVKKFALEQNITTLRNRVNELGVAEPVIQQQGSDRIVVQLPGVQDTAQVKNLLGATATLEFRLGDTEHDVTAAVQGRVPASAKLYYERDTRQPVLLKKRVIVTGDQITNAASGIEQQNGTPMVTITLDGVGAKKMSKITAANVNKPMAVVFIEYKTTSKMVNGKKVKKTTVTEEVINIATIREHFSKRFMISGLDSTKEARNLAILLRAGALAAPIEIIEERTVGPSLGQESIDQGFLSVVIGLAIVMVFMGFYYRVFGLIANAALMVNLILIVAILSMLQATLTLPGIAGIVLTVGMAVDANVLVFERIREEIRNGSSPQASIFSGYEKALSTIADANITTFIAAVILFSFGTGAIKGFAITLSIGIITSMFTAIMGTRAIVNIVYGGRQSIKKLDI
ncbi:MAG: protein translocase subunit SecD [Methylococcales bacterium]|nr:protein translocase subunit SecD [Methylococcales bacterium]MBT7408238.1 protein translocase subunit SecD [Methylococcales bacterium]